MTLMAAALLLLLQNQSAKASIEGFVVSASSGEPLGGARVTAQSKNNADHIVTTDGQGHFVLPGLDAGTYTLVAQRNGFARQAYDERATGRPGTPVNLSVGQTLKDIVFRLTPAAAVSGRISDASGEPLAGITVQLLHTTYQPDGSRRFQTVGTAQTNDRGEYRIYYVSPGRYFVSAGGRRATSMLDGAVLQPSANEVVQPRYAVAYYPGIADPSAATSLEVQAGADLRGIDFSLGLQQLFRIRGRIFDSLTGLQPKSVQLILAPRNPVNAAPSFSISRPSDYNSLTGTFEIEDLAPGSYWLETILRNEIPPRRGGSPVDVPERDVDNFVVNILPAMQIVGRLSTDDGSPLSSVSNYRAMRATFGSFYGTALLVPSGSTLAADGSFKVENLLPGEYHLDIGPLPDGSYIKEARLGRVDVLSGVSITGPVSDELDVTVSTRAGEIDGVVVDSSGRPVHDAHVVLAPNDRSRHQLFHPATADKTGQFAIRSVPPGDYKVFAWEDMEPFAYFDPDFLSKYEDLGTSVLISESRRLMIEVKSAPVGQ
jgi:hypothetical protein